MGAAQPARHIDATVDGAGAAQDRDESLPSFPDALAPVREEELESPLEQLAAVVASDVVKPSIMLEVPLRPTVAIQFDTNIDNDLLGAWRKRAVAEDPRDGTDPLKLACIVIANKATGLFVNGRQVMKEGHPLTFASQDVWAMVKPPASNGPQAIKRLYGNDAHVISTGEEVLRAAGYGDSIRQVDTDPTVARSVR